MVHKRWNININLSLTCKTAQNAVRRDTVARTRWIPVYVMTLQMVWIMTTMIVWALYLVRLIIIPPPCG